MPPLIKSVTPYRAVAGDTITILGGGFSPTAGQNKVMMSGVQASIVSETEYEVKATVPLSLTNSQFVYVMLKRGDTQEVGNGFGAFWLSPSSSLFRLASISGQVPGSPFEQDDLAAEVPDTPLAKDYERYATAAEAVQALLSKRGDLLTSTGSSPTTIGASGSGLVLEARSTESIGLRWVAPQRRITYSWGGLASSSVGYLAANGTGAASLGSGDWHGVPVQSEIVNLIVYVQEKVTPGTAINQVILYKNGSAILTSGAGLGLIEGEHYSFNVALSLTTGDVLTVAVTPGAVPPATGSGTGSVRVLVSVLTRERCNSIGADIVSTSDSASTLIVGTHNAIPSDTMDVTDTVSAK